MTIDLPQLGRVALTRQKQALLVDAEWLRPTGSQVSHYWSQLILSGYQVWLGLEILLTGDRVGVVGVLDQWLDGVQGQVCLGTEGAGVGTRQEIFLEATLGEMLKLVDLEKDRPSNIHLLWDHHLTKLMGYLWLSDGLHFLISFTYFSGLHALQERLVLFFLFGMLTSFSKLQSLLVASACLEALPWWNEAAWVFICW